MKTPEPVGQQGRWLDLLGEYDITIQHRPGRVHGNSDALSRRPCKRDVGMDCRQCSKATSTLASAPVTTSVAQPQILPPKSEATAVSQPQPTPSSESPISGTQAIGSQQATVQPTVPTIVVRTTTSPKSYTGLTSHEAYRQQFERVCDCNGWNTPLEKARHLIASLEGAAAEAVWGFKVEQDADYERIWELLQRRFGFLDESERAKRNLDLRKQGPDESITLFEQGLRTLFRRAWPQMDLKKPEFDNMVQRLFVNGLRDGALQQHLRLHARGDTFPQTVEKARIYVEANDLSSLTLKKPAVWFAQSPTRSEEDEKATYADKILDGLNKVLRAVEYNTEIKTPPPPEPPKNPTGSSNGTAQPAAGNANNTNNTSNPRNERGRNFSPPRGRNFSENRDGRSPARYNSPYRGNENSGDRRNNRGYNNNYRGQQNSRPPGSNSGGRNNGDSRPYGR